MNTALKIILGAVFLAGVATAGYYFLFSSEDRAGNTVADNTFGWKYPMTKFPTVGPDLNQLAYSDIRDPGGIPDELPVRLKIPSINVDSAIEDALITPDGRMDVPSGSVNVAWFSLGPHPGRVGSAVIGGHFGIRNGVKFVFYDLDKIQIGDKIYIENDKGDTLAFVVREIKLFNRNADATTVFTSDDGLAHLNLITCEGLWNRVNDNYPERRVIFTDAISAEAVAPFVPKREGGITKTEDIATFPRTFGIGTSGADVVALQTILEQKGFLIMPEGVAKGYFGRVTSAAVAKYQTSAGLPAVGVFGPMTRAKLLAELGDDTGLPNAGEENPPALGATSPQTLTERESLKSLYATPQDGIITSLLFFSILFMAFKIIRR